MNRPLKIYCTIACCGIDCGLCPRYHTKGNSACPGCGGINFKAKHPSCGFVTCCAIKNGFEVCSECKDYPCNRFDSERKGYDSFVTHKKVFENLDFINNHGLDSFIEQQRKRMDILVCFINKYDDGRSKNFYCISCALLPLEKLLESLIFADNLEASLLIKEKNKQLRSKLMMIAENLGVILKLNNKP